MLLSKLRKPVDTYAPWLASFYRGLRDIANWRYARPTAWGFSLAGDGSMAGSGYEPAEADTFLHGCGTHDVIFDIGANVGFYSCLAASRGKRVLAFEPAARNLRFLYRNLWANRFSSVEVFPLALGPRPGLMPLYGFGGISSLVPGWAQAAERNPCLVPVTALDLIAQDRFPGERLFIKMDVEGFELDVLAGAASVLDRRPRPTWMVEILFASTLIPGGISQKFQQPFDLFWSRGYRCSAIGLPEPEVTREMVAHWVRDGIEPGVHNFLFSAD